MENAEGEQMLTYSSPSVREKDPAMINISPAKNEEPRETDHKSQPPNSLIVPKNGADDSKF